MSDHDEAFGEAVYRAWRVGLNPDDVDHGRIDDWLSIYSDPWRAADKELSFLKQKAAEKSEVTDYPFVDYEMYDDYLDREHVTAAFPAM